MFVNLILISLTSNDLPPILTPNLLNLNITDNMSVVFFSQNIGLDI